MGPAVLLLLCVGVSHGFPVGDQVEVGELIQEGRVVQVEKIKEQINLTELQTQTSSDVY